MKKLPTNFRDCAYVPEGYSIRTVVEKEETIEERLERLRSLEIDHTPDGWPCIQMKDVSFLLDVIERMKSLK